MKHVLIEGAVSVIAYLSKYDEAVCWLKNKVGKGYTNGKYYSLDQDDALANVINAFAAREIEGHFELLDDNRFSLIIENNRVVRYLEETDDIFKYKGISNSKFLIRMKKAIEDLKLDELGQSLKKAR